MTARRRIEDRVDEVLPGRTVRDRTRFDVLLFDLGGVLIHFSGFEELNRLLADTAEDRAAIRQRWIRSEPVRRFERGDIAPDEFARRFVAEWRLDLEPGKFLHEFEGWARGLYPGAGELLDRLGASHRLACLSNSNELHTPLHRRALEPYGVRCYFSNELGLLKPQREVYDYVIADLTGSPSRVAFFDDTDVNVEAAVRAGMAGFLVDGIGELERMVRLLGL